MSRPTPCHSMSWHCIIIRLIPCPRQHEALMTINASTNKVYHQNMSADATRRKSCGHLTKRWVLFTIITIPNVSNFKNENDCIIEHYYPSLHRVSDHHSRHQPTHARTFTHTHTHTTHTTMRPNTFICKLYRSYRLIQAHSLQHHTIHDGGNFAPIYNTVRLPESRSKNPTTVVITPRSHTGSEVCFLRSPDDDIFYFLRRVGRRVLIVLFYRGHAIDAPKEKKIQIECYIVLLYSLHVCYTLH